MTLPLRRREHVRRANGLRGVGASSPTPRLSKPVRVAMAAVLGGRGAVGPEHGSRQHANVEAHDAVDAHGGAKPEGGAQNTAQRRTEHQPRLLGLVEDTHHVALGESRREKKRKISLGIWGTFSGIHKKIICWKQGMSFLTYTNHKA